MATHASDADPNPSRATTPGTKFAPMSAYPSVDPDFRVCADCFGDDGLKDFVRGHADATQCSFCGAAAREDIAAPLGEVIDHMLLCLARDYNNPDDAGMVYESAEGGYQGTVWDTYDFVLDQLGLELPNDDDNSLFDAICRGSEASSGAHGTSIRLDPMRRSPIAGRHFASSWNTGAATFFTGPAQDR
jgi:HEPN/RES N-terminal domain 1